jgi:predicted transcriptional regulator
MTEPYMEAERRCYGKRWDDFITVLMCNMGQNNELVYAVDLPIEKAKTLAADILELAKYENAKEEVKNESQAG